MQRRVLLLMNNHGKVPSAYRAVEYISGDGSPYIDTGIECTSDLAVEFRFSLLSSGGTSVCGGIDMRNSPEYFRHHCSPFTHVMHYWANNGTQTSPSISVQTNVSVATEVVIDPQAGIANINGTAVTFPALPSNLTTTKSYGIFARISDTGAIQSTPSRFYYFKFRRNGNLIGEFIPCVRKFDSKPGMYDTVSKTFYTNAGTGEFVVPA